MSATDPPLAPTLEPLGGPPRAALERLAGGGFRHVQLSASQAGLRPRELDRSGRRDLRAFLGRIGLRPSGLDLWVPPAHFASARLADRAFESVRAAIGLAADLGRGPVSLALPPEALPEVLEAIAAAALRENVTVADHAVPPAPRLPGGLGVGIDPAAWLAAGRDPAEGIDSCLERLAVVRLADFAGAGLRDAIGGGDGRLDVEAYRAAIARTPLRSAPLVADLRGLRDPWAGLARTARAWSSATGAMGQPS